MTALGVLCCFALFVCLTLLASFFLPSHLSFKNMYTLCPLHVCHSVHYVSLCSCRQLCQRCWSTREVRWWATSSGYQRDSRKSSLPKTWRSTCTSEFNLSPFDSTMPQKKHFYVCKQHLWGGILHTCARERERKEAK